MVRDIFFHDFKHWIIIITIFHFSIAATCSTISFCFCIVVLSTKYWAERDKGSTASPLFFPDQRFLIGKSSSPFPLVIPAIFLIIATCGTFIATALGWYMTFTRPTNILNLSSVVARIGIGSSVGRPLDTQAVPRHGKTHQSSQAIIENDILTMATPSLYPQLSPFWAKLPMYSTLCSTVTIIFSIISWILVLILYLRWSFLSISWGVWINLLNGVICGTACYFFWKNDAVSTSMVTVAETLQNQLQSSHPLNDSTLTTVPKLISAGYDKYGYPRRSIDYNHLGHPWNPGSDPLNPEKKLGHVISSIITNLEDNDHISNPRENDTLQPTTVIPSSSRPTNNRSPLNNNVD